MNSIELMSSMSTMSGTSPLRMAVASFVTYWPSGTGVRLIRNRFWVAWKRSTTTLTPAAVAPRHHIVTVPVEFVPKAAAVTSGSGRIPEPQAGRVAASPARPETWRNLRRSIAMSPPRGGVGRESDSGQPDPHRSDAAVGPAEVRDGGHLDVSAFGRAAVGRGGLPGARVRPVLRCMPQRATSRGDHRDAAQQGRAGFGRRRPGGGGAQVVDDHTVGLVDVLDGEHDGTAFDRDASPN